MARPCSSGSLSSWSGRLTITCGSFMGMREDKQATDVRRE